MALAATYADFLITLSVPSTTAVAVDYTTFADTGDLAVPYTDYIVAKGTVVFPANTTQQTVRVRLRRLMSNPVAVTFSLKITAARTATLGDTTKQRATVGGVAPYATVTYPGPRLAIVGDSIFYANNHWNPSSLIAGETYSRNEYYSTGMTGALFYANALLGGVLELEPALQPNTNPGANATSPNNGYNFAIYSSQVAQGNLADFDPIIGETPVAHNIGPMLNARNHMSSFDIVHYLWGTNDLSVGTMWSDILLGVIDNLLEFAAAGKWVFVHTLTPRTADLLQSINGVGGYTTLQIQAIMQGLLNFNDGLRSWISTETPANVFLVDHWAALVGPTASLLTVPTDPAGLSSPATGYTINNTVPVSSTPGNFRDDAPGSRFMYDGLHFAPPAAWVVGKAAKAAMVAAGVPASPPDLTKIGPLTIGSNLIANPGMVVTTGLPTRVPGTPLILGRSTCLGPPTPVAGVTGYDAFTNLGAGYTQGVVPDGYFLQPGHDTELADYCNFNKFTFSKLNDQPDPAPMIFQADSTWAQGGLNTSVITVDGAQRFRMVFNLAATGNANEAFTLRYLVPTGRHGLWDNYGYETGSTRTDAAPPYSPGDKLMADCMMNFQYLSNNFSTYRFCMNALNVDNADVNTSSASMSALAMAESYFPFSHIADCQMHVEGGSYLVRAPVIIAPTPRPSETDNYLQINWQFSFDGRKPSQALIDVWAPRVAKITGPAL